MIRDATRCTMIAGLGVLLFALISCATVPAPSGGVKSPMPDRDTGAPAPATTTRPPTMPGGSARPTTSAAVPTVVDSLPSKDAAAVLESIPEPLSAGEKTAAPRPSAADSAAAPADSAANLEAQGGEQVPTPAPTKPLGDKPGALTYASDSLAKVGGAPSSSASARSGTPSTRPATAVAPAKVHPDSCWRVQVAAPAESDKAVALREAAQSQLLVPMVIEIEKGLYKIRNRDCLAAAAADQLKRRALAAGFDGAFRFKGKPK